MKAFLGLFPAEYPWIGYGVLALLVLSISWLLTRLFRFMLVRFFRRGGELINLDPTTFYFMRNGISFVVYLLALIFLFYNIPAFKSIGVALFASAGIFAAIAGFASQTALANMVSGVMIVIFRPFRVNDLISIRELTGTVENITLRHTIIRDFDNQRLIIPNSQISAETILNSSIEDERICVRLQMGISYDSDVDKALEIMVEEAMKQPLRIDGRTEADKAAGEDEVRARVIGFGDSSVTLRIWAWVKNPDDGFELKWDLYKNIKKRFDAEGIEIPFPYRTIVMKKPKDEA